MTGTAYQQPENQTMMDLRPAIRMFALCAAARTVGWANAAAHVADHPELLREAELQLRRAPGVRRIAKQWRSDAEAELRENRAKRADTNRWRNR
jgi:hypothetical protein